MNITVLKGAVVSGLIMGLLAIIAVVLQAGTIFNLDWQVVINAGVLGFLSAIASVVKSLGTNVEGNFLGAVKVK